MTRRRTARRPPPANPPPVTGLKARAGAIANPKVGAQARKLLGKHYANKYRTMRRG